MTEEQKIEEITLNGEGEITFRFLRQGRAWRTGMGIGVYCNDGGK